MQRKRGLELARPFGSPLLVHRSWLGAVPLLIVYLAVTRFGADSLPVAVTFAAISAVGVFVSALAHECAHALARRLTGLRATDVTVFIFGGVTRLVRESRRRGDEIGLALVGPLASAAIGIGVLAWSTSLVGRPARVVWVIGIANLVMAAVNALPVLPLDGGAVLTAVLVARGRARRNAVRTAARWGRVVGVACVMAGAALVLTRYSVLQDAGIGLWLVVVGGFIVSEAARVQRAWDVKAVTENGTAGSWARPFVGRIRSETVVPEGGPYAVSDGSRLAGVVLPTASGRGKRARDVMVPWTPDIALGADVPIDTALQRLASTGAGVLVVLDATGVVRGVIDAEGVRARFGQR